MKKLSMIGLFLSVVSLAGCTLQAPNVPTLSTGDVQQTTGTITSGTIEASGTITDTGTPSSAMEEFTGEIDSGVVPMVSGSESVTIEQTGIIDDVKNLIEKRNILPKDTTKINEEDISLREQIIQKVQDIGK